jgi:mannose-6-phosphate isomerase-like protein (cupin superfamily)
MADGARTGALNRYRDSAPFVTKDGSTVRELMHPAVHGNRMQSLAEAVVPAGGRTLLHRHARSEELYHFTAGSGRMTLGTDSFDVHAGDTVYIPPGTAHALVCGDAAELRLLCCSSPPYSDADTELLADPPPAE